VHIPPQAYSAAEIAAVAAGTPYQAFSAVSFSCSH
jgi:hypothetical protein